MYEFIYRDPEYEVRMIIRLRGKSGEAIDSSSKHMYCDYKSDCSPIRNYFEVSTQLTYSYALLVEGSKSLGDIRLEQTPFRW